MTNELLSIANRETYCHADDKCSDASIGTVKAINGGPEQCFNYIFGPTGHPTTGYRGRSFQWTNGQCYSINASGNTYATVDKPSSPVVGEAPLPVTWTGISCYPDTVCRGARSAVVYNWEDCRRGHYPAWEGVPDSVRVNAKSFFWGGTCFTINLGGKKLTSTPVAMKPQSSPPGAAYQGVHK